VVGAGTAGCVVADRLSSAGFSVLVLEAGPSDRSLAIHIPAGLMKLDPSYDWRYEGEPDSSRNGLAEPWSAGKVIGGSSSINGMIWVRGAADDFNRWAESGCPGWEYESVLPDFRRMETYTGGGDSRYRGTCGPLFVGPLRIAVPITDRFVRAATESGHPFNEDYNASTQHGVAYLQVSQRNGLRHSAARAYLASARKRSAVCVLTNAVVHRVRFDRGRATGVEFRRGSEILTAQVNREVILSAGALASPRILMVSGIGPPDQLREHEIDVIADVPGVGANLQEHPLAPMFYAVTERTLNQDVTPLRALGHGLNFVFRRRGALASPFTTVVVFDRLDQAKPSDDYKIIFAPFDVSPKGTGSDSATYRHDTNGVKVQKDPGVTIYCGILHPRSRGNVRLRSSDPEASPRIFHELLGNDEDLREMIETCRRTREIVAAPAMKAVVSAETIPGPGVQTDQEFEGFLRAQAFKGVHPVGTCRMGSDALSVVDPRLRVRGVEGLRVVDASVMPTLTAGNTNAPTFLIGEKGSEFILS